MTWIRSIHLSWFSGNMGTWVIRCWHVYLSWARCKGFAYCPIDFIATLSPLASVKSRTVLPSWCWLTQVVGSVWVHMVKDEFNIDLWEQLLSWCLCHWQRWLVDASVVCHGWKCSSIAFTVITLYSMSDWNTGLVITFDTAERQLGTIPILVHYTECASHYVDVLTRWWRQCTFVLANQTVWQECVSVCWWNVACVWH